MIDFIKTGRPTAPGTATVARAAGACPGFGAMLTDEQIEAIVEYVRSL